MERIRHEGAVNLAGIPTGTSQITAMPADYLQKLEDFVGEIEAGVCCMLGQLCAMWQLPAVFQRAFDHPSSMSQSRTRSGKVRTYNRIIANISEIRRLFASEEKSEWHMHTLASQTVKYYGAKRGPSAECAKQMSSGVFEHPCYLAEQTYVRAGVVFASLLADIGSSNQNSIPMKDTTALICASTRVALWAKKTKKSKTCVAFFLDPYRCLAAGLPQRMNLRTFIEPAVYTAAVVGGAALSVFSKFAVPKKLVQLFRKPDAPHFLHTAIASWEGGRSSKPVKKFVEHLIALGWIVSVHADKYYRLLNQDYYYCSECCGSGKGKKKCIPQWEACKEHPQASRILPNIKSSNPIFTPRWPELETMTGVACRLNLKSRFGIITNATIMVNTGIVPRQWVETLRMAFTQFGSCQQFYSLRRNVRKTLYISKHRSDVASMLGGVSIGDMPDFSGLDEFEDIGPSQKDQLQSAFNTFNQQARCLMNEFDSKFGTGLSTSILQCSVTSFGSTTVRTQSTKRRSASAASSETQSKKQRGEPVEV